MRSISSPISRIGPLPEEASYLRRAGNLNWSPLAAAILLSILGLLTIYSAAAEYGAVYTSRQATAMVVGILAMVAVFLIGYHHLVELAPLFYGISLILLVLVLFIGREAGGAKNWLQFGPIGFQPAELAKLATALLVVRYLSRLRQPTLRIRDILVCGIMVAVPVALIAIQPDMGGAAMMMPVLAGGLLVAGLRWKHILIAGVIAGLVGSGVFFFGMQAYQRQRIMSFMSQAEDPLGAGYQLRQSMIAVGSGQLLGRGYGQGTQSQLRFLPERHTDFIMAVLAEEWGFIGVAAALFLFGLYIFSAVSVAQRARDRAGVLLIACLLGVFGFHVLYNTAMVVGLVPITGIPLPFVSYGGTFLMVNFMITGFILSVDYRRYVNR